MVFILRNKSKASNDQSFKKLQQNMISLKKKTETKKKIIMTTGEWLLPVKTHRSLESIISISVKNGAIEEYLQGK